MCVEVNIFLFLEGALERGTDNFTSHLRPKRSPTHELLVQRGVVQQVRACIRDRFRLQETNVINSALLLLLCSYERVNGQHRHISMHSTQPSHPEVTQARRCVQCERKLVRGQLRPPRQTK